MNDDSQVAATGLNDQVLSELLRRFAAQCTGTMSTVVMESYTLESLWSRLLNSGAEQAAPAQQARLQAVLDRLLELQRVAEEAMRQVRELELAASGLAAD